VIQLNHPHIVHYYGLYDDQTLFYIVMEFMDLGDLNTLLKNERRYLVQQKALMALQIANGMQYLETCKIVHRDLAARNILVKLQPDNTLVLKIADFGLARPNNYKLNKDSKVSYPWAAPEVVQKRDCTIKSDVWSFGVTFWEILRNGLQPIKVCHGDVEDYKRTMMNFSDIPQYPPTARAFFEVIWKEKPEERFSFHKIQGYLAFLLKYVFYRNQEVPTTLLYIHTTESDNNNTKGEMKFTDMGYDE